ncbi:MAG: hypothetical protein WC455_10455 [Dehalococcoidia bacterium]|jgi:hypothetical protein
MTITYYTKDIYGRPMLYPYGPGAENVLRLIGQRTVSPVQIQMFSGLGIEFMETIQPRDKSCLHPLLNTAN